MPFLFVIKFIMNPGFRTTLSYGPEAIVPSRLAGVFVHIYSLLMGIVPNLIKHGLFSPSVFLNILKINFVLKLYISHSTEYHLHFFIF